MLHKIIIIISLCCTTSLLAQTSNDDNSAPKLKISHEIGFNTIALIQQALSIGDNDSTSQPSSAYLFSYRTLFNERHGIRVGLGASLNSSSFQQEGFSDVRTNNNANYDARLGYEYRFSLHPLFKAYAGVDVAFQYTTRSLINNSGFDEVKFINSTSSIGIGPVLGIQYYIRPNVWLGTESSLYYWRSREVGSREFRSNPQFNDGREITIRNQIKMQAPIALYLGWSF